MRNAAVFRITPVDRAEPVVEREIRRLPGIARAGPDHRQFVRSVIDRRAPVLGARGMRCPRNAIHGSDDQPRDGSWTPS
jgi:hypothetical protein